MITRIEKKLLTYLVVVFCTLLVLVILVYRGVQTMKSTGNEVTHTLKVKEAIKELESQLSRTGESAREYYLTGDQQLLTEFTEMKSGVNAQLINLSKLTNDNQSQLDRIDRLRRLIDERFKLKDLMVRARQREEYDVIVRFLREKQLKQNKFELAKTIQEMENEEQQLYIGRSKKEASDSRLAAAIAVIGIMIATASLALTGAGLRHEIAKQLEGEQRLREREKELHLALSASNAGLWFWDIPEKQVTWSAENYEVFGFEPSAFQPSYDLWLSCLHDEDRDRVERELEAAIGEKRNFKTEHRIVWPNGENRRLLVKGQAEYDQHGKPARMSGICLDITELRQTEEALYESEERFRQIAENIEAVLWIRNYENNRLEFISRGIERLWGINSGKMMSGEIAWADFVHPDDQNAFSKLASHHWLGNSQDQEYRIVLPDGRQRWVRDRAFPVKDRRGKILRIAGFTVDTTERKQTEEFKARLLAREQEAREQAESANRSKDEFLAVVSHELRSPLNAMLGWARVLRSENVDQQTHDHAIKVIEQSAEMQSRLIEDLLDSARIASGKLRIEPRPVNLIPVIQAAIDTVFPVAENKGIVIESNLDSAAAMVTGDAERLQQIVWNVLANAVKFTPKGGQVEIELKRQESNIVININDTGKGIRAEDLPFIFDRFHQADSSSTRRAGGLGLGLSLVKSLVELHGGSIQAQSEGEGKGASFSINLPLGVLSRTDNSHTAEIGGNPERTTGSLSFPPILAGLNILTVDDEAQARDLVATLLRKSGATVTTASSSFEAMEILTGNSAGADFDLIVSDIGMPEENGYTLIRRIRKLPGPIGNVPAIALTAFGSAEDRINAFEAGFQMHVPKPVEPAELMMVIARLTGRSSNAFTD